MNKPIWFRASAYLALILCLVLSVNAATDDAEVYYSLDDADLSAGNPQDASGNTRHGTNNGADTGQSGASCVLNQCFDFVDANNDYVSTASYDRGSAFAVSAWLKLDDATPADTDTITSAVDWGVTFSNWFYVQADGTVVCRIYESQTIRVGRTTNAGAATTNLDHWVCTYDGGTTAAAIDIYKNNVAVDTTDSNQGSFTSWNQNPGIAQESGGMSSLGSSVAFDGFIDEIAYYSHDLSTADVAELYNSGSGYNPYAAPAAFSDVQVFDSYDNSSLGGLTVYQGTLNNVTESDGTAYFWENDGLNYTIDGSQIYFNQSGTSVQNGTVQVSIYGAMPNISVFDIEGTNVLNFTLTSPETANWTADGSAHLLLTPNSTLDVDVLTDDYVLYEGNITTGAMDDGEKNITGLYSTFLTINATNAFSGAVLSNFSGFVYNNDTAFNHSYSTTGNNATLFEIYGNHTAYIDVFGYSISADNWQAADFSSVNETITFALYSENSVSVNILDIDTGLPITQNITLNVVGNSSYTNSTTSGELFVDTLIDGNYSFQFSGGNYSSANYAVTVADRSHQTLNAFLSASAEADTVTFTVYDFDSSQTIEGVTFLQEREINSTWTTVSTSDSDITGRVQFSYTEETPYRFTLSKTGYESRIFELDPVIFTSYTIKLQRELVVDKEIGLFDVNVIYYPVTFENEANNTFNMVFGSAGGSLETYGYTLTYPGGTNTETGLSANGESFSMTPFVITGASYGDYVNLTYWYDSTLGENKTYNKQFVIDGATNDQTLAANENEDYGLGALEKILIAVVGTLIFAGVLTLFGTPVAGVVGGLVALGIFVSIGFVSLWVAVPTFVVAIIILMRRTSEG